MKKTIYFLLILIVFKTNWADEKSKKFSFDSVGELTLKTKVTIKKIKFNKVEQSLTRAGDYELRKSSLWDKSNNLIWEKEILVPPAWFRPAGSVYLEVYSVQEMKGQIYIAYHYHWRLFIEVIAWHGGKWVSKETLDMSEYLRFGSMNCTPMEINGEMSLNLSGIQGGVLVNSSILFSKKDASVKLTTDLYPVQTLFKKQPKESADIDEEKDEDDTTVIFLCIALVALALSLVKQFRVSKSSP
jgi:hypothetical protein